MTNGPVPFTPLVVNVMCGWGSGLLGLLFTGALAVLVDKEIQARCSRHVIDELRLNLAL